MRPGSTGMYLDETSARYFGSFHSFCPIIGRRAIQTRLLSFWFNPQSEFALLLLCIGLLTHAEHCDLSLQPARHMNERMLYLATKSLMAQVQAQVLCAPTTRLFQTGILLSVYEYAHGHEQAFVTIGIYVRMVYAAQLRSQPSPTTIDQMRLDMAEEKEEINTWWGIRICERCVHN
ncbi:fungal specific transcription factor domain-containing protein [Aspergillus affinis]|uniref:fungal specific transcription factor domain-containing protein n=1 Tax=Aspergillus affinis TaxID=1070780 RepID=UPI0022FEA741|nr:uncharacterized protein KD926_007400 [Aspergillus affinis]KAI9041130.1 hypothetical protein KD926_007400 [Aspergillus affinis]